ncbi:MAG: phage tail tape measure protein [Draconibacterium sp.]|nr:phage tail tape measure protein [Draconibacterium sp.]
MNKHQADLRKVQTGWFSLGKAAETANKYMSGAMAVTAALMGIIMGLRKAAKAAMDFEERLDNLSALTGLEGRQLQWLGDTAKETSVSITETGVRIKQSATDIIDAYTKVGSQRPELLKNKEALNEVTKAAIILSEAAKSDLEPAVKGLTMAMNQHNLGASEATRIINSFAAGSKLGAANIPYLTAVIEKSGTTLNMMNISLEENIALTEAIAPSFSEAAAAGTSLDRTFLKIQIMFMRKRTAAQMMNVAALKKAIFYEQAFGKALMANPVGLVIAAIGLLVVAIKSYDRYSEQAIAREK